MMIMISLEIIYKNLHVTCISIWYIKIIDLSMPGKFGTPIYIMEDGHHGSSVDVYSFAILAYKIVTRKEHYTKIEN